MEEVTIFDLDYFNQRYGIAFVINDGEVKDVLIEGK